MARHIDDIRAERRENSRMLLLQPCNAGLQRRIAPIPRRLGDLVGHAEIAVQEAEERRVRVDLDEGWTGPCRGGCGGQREAQGRGACPNLVRQRPRALSRRRMDGASLVAECPRHGMICRTSPGDRLEAQRHVHRDRRHLRATEQLAADGEESIEVWPPARRFRIPIDGLTGGELLELLVARREACAPPTPPDIDEQSDAAGLPDGPSRVDRQDCGHRPVLRLPSPLRLIPAA